MRILLLFLLVLMAGGVFAQQGEDENIKFDDVKVVKEFNANLRDFNKINIEPVLPAFDLKNRRFEYQVRAIPAKLNYEKPQIRPLALKPEPVKPVNKYYLKLGYGIPKFLKGDFSMGYKKDNSNANLSLHYNSADDSESVKDKRNSSAGIDLLYFNRNNELDLQYGLNANIDGDYLYLYAVEANKDSVYSSSQNKRRLVRGDIKLFLQKDELVNSLSDKLELRYGFLQLNTNESLENNLFLKNTLSYSINENMYLDMPLHFDYIPDDSKYIYRFNPQFVLKSKLVNFKAGADYAKSQDLSYIKPFGELSTNLFHNFFEVFLSVDNDIVNNSQFVKTYYNPFIDFDHDTIATSLTVEYAAGVRSSLEGVKLEAKAVYQDLENMLLFTVSPADARMFVPLYDNGTNLKFVANANYRVLPNILISGTLTKNFYNMENEEKAWYKPDFTANFTTGIAMLNDKLHVKGELFFASQSWYKDLEGKKYKLDPLFDISGTVRYRLHKSTYFFGEVNNIFAQKYQKWYQYPTYGINILAGMEIGF